MQDIVKTNRANTSYCLASSLRDGVCHTIAASAAVIASAPAISIVEPQLYAEATASDAPKQSASGNPENIQLAAQQPAAPTATFQQPSQLPRHSSAQPSAQAAQQVRSAVSGGNFAGVQALIKKDSSVTSTAVVALVSEAKKNVVTDPALSAQALQLAAGHAKEISPDMAPQVTEMVKEIVEANKGRSSDCDDVCQAINVAAAEFLSDVQVAFENPDDLQLAQQPTAPIAHFQQPVQVWLTTPNPPSVNTLASGF